jgi:hypothetical protein
VAPLAIPRKRKQPTSGMKISASRRQEKHLTDAESLRPRLPSDVGRYEYESMWSDLPAQQVSRYPSVGRLVVIKLKCPLS